MSDLESTIWSFVDLATGEFTGGEAVGPLSVGFAQPPGILAVLGRWPRDAWRYDLQLQRVVPRSELTEAERAAQALALERAQQVRQARIDITDAELQLARPLREVVLALIDGLPPPPEAVMRLLDAETTIAGLRPLLKRENNTQAG